jgi:hypothetical protein
MVSGSKALSGGRRDCIGIRQAPRLVLPTIEVPYIARGGGRRVQSDTLPINHERQKTAAVAKKPPPARRFFGGGCRAPIKRTRASGRRGAIGTVGTTVPTVGSSRYEEDLESSGLAPGAVCLAPTAGLWRIIFSHDCASDSQDLFSASLCVPSAMCWQYSAFRRYSSRLSITPHSTVFPGTSRRAFAFRP